MKKLIPAVVMLLVSAVVLSTASYAWFTTSNQVSADGLSVTATAPSSILIRGQADGEGGWTEFSNTLNFADIYANVKLTPASSANGKDFYIPANAYDAAGAMDYMTDISLVTAGSYYADFQIDLKNDSVNTEVDIAVKDIENSITSAMNNAIRVAIIVGTPREATVTATTPTPGASNITIYTEDDYVADWVNVANKDALGNLTYNVDGVGPISGPLDVVDGSVEGTTATTYDAWQAVAKGTASNYTAHNTTKFVTLAPQQCVTVTIRVWFEGQDASCISANAGAKANLTIAFAILGEPREVTTPAESQQ